MNTREAYDRIKTWFEDKAHDRCFEDSEDGPLCKYYSDGERCAVGVLIPPKMYEADMEGRAVSDLVRSYPALKERLGGVDINFLEAAQRAHDDSEDKQEFLKRFRGLWSQYVVPEKKAGL